MNAVSPVLNNSLIDQWFLCANACFEIPMDIQKDLRSLWTKEVPTSIIEWGYQFEKDLYGAHYGYSSLSAQHDPYTEICIETLLQEKSILQYCKPHIRQPTLCISHDVDHLSISGKLILKRLISERQLISYRGSTKSFLPSLRKLLKLSAPLSRNTKSVATVFAASPLVSKNPLYWPMQWLIDPSYNVVHSRFNEFSELLKEFQCDVGLHGSFYSLSKNFLEKEKENLELALGQDITLLRQHWLHLPGKEAWNVIGESKFQIDSTLGWNGNVGFRGGMARPFELIVDNKTKKRIWEVPLLLMDGPLFCDLNMSPKEILELAKGLLKKVIQRGGCVSINWHERAAHPSYHWDGLLEEILTFAVSHNFQFLTLNEAVKEHLND